MCSYAAIASTGKFFDFNFKVASKANALGKLKMFDVLNHNLLHQPSKKTFPDRITQNTRTPRKGMSPKATALGSEDSCSKPQQHGLQALFCCGVEGLNHSG